MCGSREQVKVGMLPGLGKPGLSYKYGIRVSSE